MVLFCVYATSPWRACGNASQLWNMDHICCEPEFQFLHEVIRGKNAPSWAARNLGCILTEQVTCSLQPFPSDHVQRIVRSHFRESTSCCWIAAKLQHPNTQSEHCKIQYRRVVVNKCAR